MTLDEESVRLLLDERVIRSRLTCYCPSRPGTTLIAAKLRGWCGLGFMGKWLLLS